MRSLQKISVLLWLVFCCTFLFGCWDIVELDEIFIATAIAIDATENEEEFEVTIEVAKTGNVASSSSSKGGEDSNQNTILLKEKSNTLLGAFEKLNYDSSRSIILQHCKVLLISREIAEKNIIRFVDFFLRGRQPRLEIFMAVVDGSAGEILSIDPPQEATSSAYIVGIIKDMSKISKEYKLRVLDFINQLLYKSRASTMPVIAKMTVEDQDEIKLSGKAFFKNGKLMAIKPEKEVVGYLLAKNKIKGQIFTADDQEGKICFYIDDAKLKEKLKFDAGKLKVDYKLKADLQIAEIIGFSDYHYLEFLNHAKLVAKKQLETIMQENIDFLKEINTDALDFSTKIYKTNPKLWKSIEDNWDYIFENAEINIEVDVNIPSAGKSAESIEMEMKKNEY